jgi:hypothetical protein
VVIGEFLSLPLFALLLWLLPGPLELFRIGLCWLLAYAVYAIFNAVGAASPATGNGPALRSSRHAERRYTWRFLGGDGHGHARCGGRFGAGAAGRLGALAQETPEAAYAQLHAATLAGKIDAALGFVAGPLRADLAAKPQAEREGLFRTLAQAMPKTYRVLDKSVDGDAAQLIATGISEYQGGRTEAYLSASLRKEGETWKVASWTWSSQKPAALAAQARRRRRFPRHPFPHRNRRSCAGCRGATRTPRQPPPTAIAAKPAAVAGAAAPTRGPSRAHLDARECLKLPTDSAIRACAEKYR